MTAGSGSGRQALVVMSGQEWSGTAPDRRRSARDAAHLFELIAQSRHGEGSSQCSESGCYGDGGARPAEAQKRSAPAAACEYLGGSVRTCGPRGCVQALPIRIDDPQQCECRACSSRQRFVDIASSSSASRSARRSARGRHRPSCVCTKIILNQAGKGVWDPEPDRPVEKSTGIRYWYAGVALHATKPRKFSWSRVGRQADMIALSRGPTWGRTATGSLGQSRGNDSAS